MTLPSMTSQQIVDACGGRKLYIRRCVYSDTHSQEEDVSYRLKLNWVLTSATESPEVSATFHRKQNHE